MLKIKNVRKTFGDIVALGDISFDVNDGEFVFITGPSGSGKTTLLRLITRELLPDQGEIALDKIDVTKLRGKEIPLYRQKLGIVFQDFKVLPEKTVKENVEMALAVCGVDRKEWNDRVNHVVELVGLGKRANLFPSQLSGGELQRVSLARSLVVNPKIILADEPTGNLDWKTADMIMDLFDKVNKEGKTVLVATHHEKIIDKMKKRTIKLKVGHEVVEANPEEIKEVKEETKKEKTKKKEKEN